MSESNAAETRPPLIGVITCSQHLAGQHPAYMVGAKYVRAAALGAGGIPVAIPALGDELPLDSLLGRLDGVLLTGSPSSVEPRHYSVAQASSGNADPGRDATSLPLIRGALDQGVPLLGICRGFQEINVALGGTLHQKLHETGRYSEHREDKDLSFREQYERGHTVRLTPGSLLSRIWPHSSDTRVNSLHGQGIDRLAAGLSIEATAEDGLIEAFSVEQASAFALAVQWHPEWQWQPGEEVGDFPFYRAILRAFGDACRARSLRR